MDLSEKDFNALAVAYLLKEGNKQEEIRKGLRLASQTEVSRLRAHAVDKKWLTVEVHWPDGLDEALKERIKNKSFPEKSVLDTKLDRLSARRNGVPVRSFHIVHESPSTDAEERKRHFGHSAAEHLVPLIAGTKSCAVAWGRTIRLIVDQVHTLRCPARQITFMPISGEPLNYTDTGVSPSTAAERLADAFHGSRALSLQGVPARIPKDMSAESGIIRQFIERCHHYNQIFGSETALQPVMGGAQMILTGIGDIRTSVSDPWFHETEEMEGDAELEKIAVGNIGGVWIPKDPNDQDQSRKIDEINERWLGIQKTHFMHCANAAETTAKPGVVVVAFEPEKAHVLHRTIGMVNHIVASQPLAQALLDLLDRE